MIVARGCCTLSRVEKRLIAVVHGNQAKNTGPRQIRQTQDTRRHTDKIDETILPRIASVLPPLDRLMMTSDSTWRMTSECTGARFKRGHCDGAQHHAPTAQHSTVLQYSQFSASESLSLLTRRPSEYRLVASRRPSVSAVVMRQ